MTPAENPSDDASTLRDANLTIEGKNTTAAPIPVEALAAMTSPKAMATVMVTTLWLSVGYCSRHEQRCCRKDIDDSSFQQTDG
mmetsp:Transcript_17476/g.49904  ORF Transcript_17476/g.49904 Transcript_17476/m.49904 type:complete len:83 (-) Transcript_17476:81-329(-)